MSLFFLSHCLIHAVQKDSDENLTGVCLNKEVENYGQHCLCHIAQLIFLHAFAFVGGIYFCGSGNNIAHNNYSRASLFSGMQGFGALQYQLLPETNMLAVKESGEGCIY